MSVIQQTIERSFFEAIRLLLVSEGYTPDISDTTAFPNTDAGYDAYLLALKTIAEGTKGFAIEVFGTANPQDRGYKALPRITLQTSAFLPGDVGFDTTPQPVLNPATNKYDLYSYDSRTYDLFLDCRVSTKTQEQLRILMDIIHRAIPLMGSLVYYNDATDHFQVNLDSFQSLIDSEDGILEYNYRYEVPDIQWVDIIKQVTIPAAGIAPVSLITLNATIEDRLLGVQGSFGVIVS